MSVMPAMVSVEAVLAGKPADALAITDRAHERGADLGVLLGDMLELIHVLTRLKSVPGLRNSSELPEAERFHRLLPERKQFLDTIKLISYRAETSMASVLRETLTRSDDARALLRQIYTTEADLFPDAEGKTLTVCLHHLTQAAHDQALRHLCDELNATETIFPGTDLRLIYKIGSC